jgi:hypothetical protein
MIFSMTTFRFAGLALDTAEREKNGEQAYGPLARRTTVKSMLRQGRR